MSGLEMDLSLAQVEEEIKRAEEALRMGMGTPTLFSVCRGTASG